MATKTKAKAQIGKMLLFLLTAPLYSTVLGNSVTVSLPGVSYVANFKGLN